MFLYSFLKKEICNYLISRTTLLILLITCHHFVFSQDKQPTDNNKIDVSGSIEISNDGISTIPALSLGEPAALFRLSVGKRFTFEPELDFSLKGKPWQFIFWLRYKFIQSDKFQLQIGITPSVSFVSIPTMTNGIQKEALGALRFPTGELNAGYAVTKHVRIGAYYMYVHGVDKPIPGLPVNMHFVNLNSTISDIGLFSDFFLTLSPQIFYLKIDHTSGLYAATGITLGKKNLPISITSSINKAVHTNIIGNPDPLWNISLVYSFPK